MLPRTLGHAAETPEPGRAPVRLGDSCDQNRQHKDKVIPLHRLVQLPALQVDVLIHLVVPEEETAEMWKDVEALAGPSLMEALRLAWDKVLASVDDPAVMIPTAGVPRAPLGFIYKGGSFGPTDGPGRSAPFGSIIKAAASRFLVEPVWLHGLHSSSASQVIDDVIEQAHQIDC